jgi:HlyD family secretion protein
MGDGFRVEVRVILEESINVLKVPAGAMFNTEAGPAVFAIEGGKSVQRTVKTGRRNGLEVEIVEGLAEGALVILHPPEAVKDGVAISPR